MQLNHIIFYNQWHIGDIFLSQGIIRQFYKNNPTLKFSYAITCGSYIFADMPEIDCIDIDSNPNFRSNLYSAYFAINENTIAINTWVMGILIGNWSKQVEYECIIYRQYAAMQRNVGYINSSFQTNIQLPNCTNDELLPIIKHVDLSKFLSWREKNNQKLILYYNYDPKSGQHIGNINHDLTIFNLAIRHPDKTIIVTKVSEQLKNTNMTNIIDAGIFGYIETKTCENIALLYHIEKLCDYGIHYDIGACFFYIPVDFRTSKCKILHGSMIRKFYDALRNNSSINDEEYYNKYLWINTSQQEEYLNALCDHIR